MHPTFLQLVVGIATGLGVLSIGMLICDAMLRQQTRMSDRLRDEFQDMIHDRVQQSPLFRDLQQASAEIETALPTLGARLQTRIEQAGMMWSVAHVAAAMLGMAALSGGLIWLWCGKLFIAIPCGVVAAIVLPLYIHQTRKSRIRLLCRQLPMAFEVMSRALRAGQSIAASFQVVASDFPLPIREEFAHCYEQQHLGVAHDVALRDLARRTGVVETQIFAVALIINRRAGGNLAELLSKLALTMRTRAKFQARVRALTGEGRMQAAALIALPIIALGAILVLNPEYGRALLDRPKLLAIAGGAQLLGAACIHKIINFKF